VPFVHLPQLTFIGTKGVHPGQISQWRRAQACEQSTLVPRTLQRARLATHSTKPLVQLPEMMMLGKTGEGEEGLERRVVVLDFASGRGIVLRPSCGAWGCAEIKLRRRGGRRRVAWACLECL
jgi:hypothetical protein